MPVKNLFCSILLLMSVAASAQTTESINAALPDSIRVGASEKWLCSLEANGSQIYQCVKKGTEWVWEHKGPEADLTLNGKKVGKHYAGPTWEYSDGSKVGGNVLKSSPAKDPTRDVPLFLIKGNGMDGKGKFCYVTKIQRVNTKGGVKPTTKPDASNEGKIVWVPYTATYHF